MDGTYDSGSLKSAGRGFPGHHQYAAPQPGSLIRESVDLTNDARRDIPSTLIATSYPSTEYVKAAAEHPEWAWLAGLSDLRNATWIDMPTSHWPMWSKPRELAEIIGSVAREHATAG